jgi:hypothetical protein
MPTMVERAGIPAVANALVREVTLLPRLATTAM